MQALVDLGISRKRCAWDNSPCEICRREELVPGLWYVSQAMAAALLGAGRPREAAALVDELIEEAQRWNVGGLMLGTVYELRARAAIAEGSEGDFARFSQLCREQYRPDRVPALAAKFQRLLRAAERSGIGQTHAPAAPGGDVELVTLHTLVTTAHSRLMECEGAKTRAECILKILTEQLAPKAAYLYGVTDGEVQLLGAMPRKQPPAGLSDLMQEYLESELELDGRTMTGFVEEDGLDSGEARFKTYMQKTAQLAGPRLLSHGGTHIQPITLVGSKDGELQIAGIAALQVKSLAVAAPPAVLLEVLAKALLANDNAAVVARQR